VNSQALYRKYRSRTLDEVLGQEHVTSVLKRALEKSKIAHAYLLTGPRGVGKTSVARILAHEINQLPYDENSTHLDIIEIDAASNNGVDDIRNLREKAQVAPTSAPKKIYIIDEVHMLSKAAFNALLKTLEEPPEHVVFILATTDADKLPSTILSRVQQFYFHPIRADVMAKQLQNIAKKEGFKIDAAAAELIAERSHGGFRDGISLLDQLSVLASDKEPLTAAQVAAHLGLTDEQALEKLIVTRETGDSAGALNVLRQLYEQGTDPQVLTTQLLRQLRANLAQRPELVELIGELIEISRHPHPDLKLLTIFARPKIVTNVPAQSPISQAGSPPTDIAGALGSPLTESQILRDGKSSSPSANANASRPAKSPKQSAARDSDGASPIEARSEAVSDDFGGENGAVNGHGENASASTFTGTLDWQQFLDAAKTTSSGLYTLLNKCGHALTPDGLTLYAGTNFAKKKLDDAKFRPIISELIQQVAQTDLNITITSDKKPPEDEQLAEIAAMMGGGEEVKLDELETA
jgi:DNA polymerase-3 subunit gamma/tau